VRGTVPYQLFADLVLSLHVAIVAFVIGGLVVVLVGNLIRWQWVNRLWFRLAHLGAIAIIVAETWFGLVCPLTTLEMWLRRKAGETTYGGSFVQHWLQSILYYNAPPWVFTVAYSLFGLAVVATWWFFPPTRTKKALDAPNRAP